MSSEPIESQATRSRVAVIGSFKQFYREVLTVRHVFEGAGLEVTSPSGKPIIEEGVDFVRFTSDDATADDHLVQTRTLALILGSDVVYVVCPGGYIGRTTCYEVGRVRQAEVPLYFSEHPRDLPILVPESRILSADSLATRVLAGNLPPWDHRGSDEAAQIERSLLRSLGGPT